MDEVSTEFPSTTPRREEPGPPFRQVRPNDYEFQARQRRIPRKREHDPQQLLVHMSENPSPVQKQFFGCAGGRFPGLIYFLLGRFLVTL